MQNVKTARLVEGPIIRTLVELTLPMLIGILGMVVFNLVDTYFVGQLGTAELAAISFTFPVVMVIGSVAMGLGVGASALVSRAIGEGNADQARRLTTDSLILSLLVVLLFVGGGLLTLEPTFLLLGVTPQIMPLVREYMLVWYLGMIFVVMPMVGNNAIRATGDTKTPSAIMLVAVVVNIILDPLFIFGWGPFPRWELFGAAVATVIARMVVFFVSMWVLYYRERLITFDRPALSEVAHSWRRVLFIGLPAGGSNMILPITLAVLTSIVATYGPSAVAALGVATRLDMFALMMVMALATALAPFVGQNWGAGNQQRVEQAVRYSLGFTLGWGLFMYAVWQLLGEHVAVLFNDEPAVIRNILLYLSIVPMGYAFQGILTLSANVLNVLNKPYHATLLMSGQAFGLLIPLAFAGSYFIGLTGVFAAVPFSSLIMGLIAYGVLRHVLRNMEPASMTVTTPMAAQLAESNAS